MFRALILSLFLLGTVCAECPVGSFINSDSECVQCPFDTYNDVVDATSCKQCPNGMISGGGSTSIEDCTDCAPGMFVVEGDECVTCGSGTFNPVKNARSCRICPKGTFSNTYNPQFCRRCPPGRVSDNRGTAVCRKCRGKRYQFSDGKRKCRRCPPKSVANPDGASCRPLCKNKRKRRCRSCKPGFELKRRGKCKRCPRGTINAYRSNTRCQKCPQAEVYPFDKPRRLVPNKKRTRCICRKGEFLFFEMFLPTELNPFCGKCPEGQTSDGVTCSEKK